MSNTPCWLTALLSLAFISVGLVSVVVIVTLAVWLPIEIKQGGEIIKAENSINFEVRQRNGSRRR